MRRWKYRILSLISLLIFIPSVLIADSVTTFQLNNGLSVLVKPDHRAPVVLVQVWYRVGGSSEPNGITGVSHVLEHMMFQGTKRYPAGVFNQLIEQHGGIQNAMTTADFTMYYEELPTKYLSLALELEADRMEGLILNEQKFQKEMQVVKTEKRLRYDNNPQGLTYSAFMAAAHVANPYHQPVIGWQNDLDHLQLSDAKTWYETWYAPNNAILVIVGDVDATQVRQKVSQYFASLTAKKIPLLKPRREENRLGYRRVSISAPANVPFMIEGYNVPVYKTSAIKDKKDIYALTLLSSFLGGSNSARLVTELVKKQKIASDISVMYDPFSLYDNALTIFAVPAQNHSIADLTRALQQQINKIRQQRLTSTELNRVKAQVIAQRVYEKDSLVAEASILGNLETIGLSYQTEATFIAGLQQVTAAEIQQVAQQYLVKNNQTIAILSPTKITSQEK